MTARLGRRRPLLGAVLASACLLLCLPLVSALRAGAEDGDVTVTATPTTDLADGQLVTINVKSSVDVAAARVQVCRSGVDYQTQTGPRPNTDFLLGGINCTNAPVSSSADISRTEDDNVTKNAKRPEGATILFRVGVGTAAWTSVTDSTTKEQFDCTPESGCSLVLELRYGDPILWHPVVFPLTFRQTDALAGCGGANPASVLSVGSDRIQDAWTDWTLDECHLPGRTQAATKPGFQGEGLGVQAFNSGRADLAYTAAGYGQEVGFMADEDQADLRPSIAVPVAVEATVLAVAGGFLNDIGNKVPYTDLKLKPEEAAGLFTGGPSGVQPYFDAIFARNEQLHQNFFDNGGSTSIIAVAAPAAAEMESWVFTKNLTELAPDAWKVPNTGAFGEDAGKARGASAELATAQPSFASAIATLTGRPPLASANAKIVGNRATQGGMWVLTDLETATALGMTPVALANASGDFVPVDEDSIYAGVASMKETDNGYLLPDFTATDKVDGITPYPLTMVEYAMVPAEPLVDKDCKLKKDSQTLLDGWLKYLTGAGQDKMPVGMFPLPDALKARAASQIELVGKSETTGDCAGKVTDPDDDGGTTGGDTGGTTGGTTSTGGSTGGTTGGGTTTTGGTTGGTTGSNRSTGRSTTRTTAAAPSIQPSNPAATDTTGGDEEAIVTVPAFAGRRAVPWLPLVAALLGVTALSGLAAVASGNRRRPPPGGPGS